MSLALLGNLLVAVASTAQATRWLLVEGARLQERRDAAATRVDRLAVKRESDQAGIDWLVWSIIAIGAWMLLLAEIF